MKKTTLYAIIGILIILSAVVIGWFSQQNETQPAPEEVACTMDALQCPDGSFVGRVPPRCEFAPCPDIPAVPTTSPTHIDNPEIPADVQASIDAKADLIRVSSPVPFDTLRNGSVTVHGEARGSWFFEASFPIVIVDWDGKIIGQGFATADGEWMTEQLVPFTGTVSYALPPDTPYKRGAIIFQKDNPSGLPEHDNALEIPITFE